MRRYITIGRHEYTSIQKQLLAKAGLTEEIAKVPHVTDVDNIIKLAKDQKAAIVVQALPLPLMIELVVKAKQHNIPVFVFKIESVGLMKAENIEEAKRLAEQNGCDLYLFDEKSKTVRLRRTVALQRIKEFKVVYEADDVATI